VKAWSFPWATAAMAWALLLLLAAGCGSRGDEAARSFAPSPAEEPAPAGKPDPVDPKLLAEGKKAWRKCAACHCATDARIPEDADWERLNEETTCIAGGDPAPRLRKCILAYLRHPGTLRPVLVDETFKPREGKKAGQVLVPATAGSAYLKAERDSIRTGTPSMVRLYWPESARPKTLAVPAGEYSVINYWLYHETGEKGEHRWMATATNVDGCTQAYVEPGEEALLDLQGVLYGELTCTPKEKVVTLNFAVNDMGGNSITLSKDGRVVMPDYRILDRSGGEVARGTFNVI